jgi:ribonuclease PH
MVTGAILALVYALFAMIGAMGGIAFCLAAGTGK